MQGKRNTSSNDYFTANRDIPWWVAMFSIVATETSVLTFISIPGLAYRDNWFFLQLAMGYIVGRILVSIFLLPQYCNSGITSIYQVLGEKFGKNVQKIASVMFLVTRVLADSIRFLATAVIVQVITGWPIWIAVLIIGIFTAFYTLSGGLRTVLWIDTFQFILYLLGGGLVIYFIMSSQEFSSLSSLSASGKFNIFRFSTDNMLFDSWYFFSAFIGGTLLSFASHGSDHMMVQRVLSCRNLTDARKAMIGSGLFVFIQFTVFLLAGSLIWLFLGGIDIAKDREFSTFIVEYLPIGMKGFLLAGVLSAAMSTLSSSINSLASSTTTDIIQKPVTLLTSRKISLLWATILIGIALLFDESDTAIVIIGLRIASYTYGGLLGLFILSRIKKQFNDLSIIFGLISSVLIVFILQNIGIAWTWFIGISVLVNLLIANSTQLVLNSRK